MDERTTGIIIFTIISLVTSIIGNFFNKNYWLTVLITAVISNVLFQIAATIHLGHLDPFFIIALIVGGFYSLIISAVVGAIFILIREYLKTGF
jgi:hypothetical protein